MFHLILTATIFSTLVHPIILVSFIFQRANYLAEPGGKLQEQWLAGLSGFNLAAGYTTYGVMAMATTSRKGSPSAVGGCGRFRSTSY